MGTKGGRGFQGYNLMEPPLYMWSIFDQKVIMWHMNVEDF